MSAFDGLPDFGTPIEGGPAPIYAAFGRPDLALVLPDQLGIATLGHGSPDLQVSLTRPALPTSAPWGALRFRVVQRCPVVESLPLVRDWHPGATVAAARPAAGFARLVSAGTALALPEVLATPQAVDWTSAEALRFTLPRLDVGSVSLLKGALLDSALLVWARLEIDVPGVSPRLPVRVSVAVQALLAAILPPPPAPRQIPWGDLVGALMNGAGSSAMTVDGRVEAEDQLRLAEAIADRIRAAFGRLVPSRTGEHPTIAFDEDAEVAEVAQWDLSLPIAALRPWALALDPLEAPRAMAAQGRLADLLVERTAPLIQVGSWDVYVSANLPARREGIAAIGVTLRAPARPPMRVQDETKTFELRAPTDQGVVRLQLGPLEPLLYHFSPYVILMGSHGPRRLDGPEGTNEDALLELASADFPVVFVPVSATADLLAEAGVLCRLRYTAADQSDVEVPFGLSPGAGATSVALPRDATSATLVVTVTPHDGSDERTLAPLPAAPLSLGPWSFPEYGPQHILIDVHFGEANTGIVAIDLIPEGQEESPSTVTTVQMSPEAPRREWTYFAMSPFHAGYRYRRFVASGPPERWSPPQSPAVPLILEPEISTGPAAGSAFDLLGVHLYPDPTPARVLRYIPAAPIPARMENGQPLLSLIDAGASGAFLQLSIRFDLDEGERDRLRVALAADHLDLTVDDLQPAPLRVDTVIVQMSAAQGADPVVLGTSSGSGIAPWDAVFSLRLTPDQAARAREAFNGQTGILTVLVHATLAQEAAASFPDQPGAIDRTADVAGWLIPAPTPAYAQAPPS